MTEGKGVAAPVFVDERQVRRAFDKAAATYAAHADIEREIGQRMLERLDYVRIDPRWIIDFGCGPDIAASALQARYGNAGMVGLDISEAMLRTGQQQGRRRRGILPQLRSLFGELHSLFGSSPAWRPPHNLQKTCANAAATPLRTGVAQLVWSNLLLPWCNDPVPVIAEMHRVLEPGGLVMFSTLGPDTLKELRTAFADGQTHTQRFIDMHDLGDMLVHAGFADPVVDMEMVTLEYASLDRVLADLRRTGAVNAMHDRPRGLTGKAAWQRARERFENTRRNGKLPLTLEVIYGHAWKTAPRKTADGRSVIRFQSQRPGSPGA